MREYLDMIVSGYGLNNNIRIVGEYTSRKDIRSLLGLCDIFVFPSLYEGLGIALLEAMAMQKPALLLIPGLCPK